MHEQTDPRKKVIYNICRLNILHLLKTFNNSNHRIFFKHFPLSCSCSSVSNIYEDKLACWHCPGGELTASLQCCCNRDHCPAWTMVAGCKLKTISGSLSWTPEWAEHYHRASVTTDQCLSHMISGAFTRTNCQMCCQRCTKMLSHSVLQVSLTHFSFWSG